MRFLTHILKGIKSNKKRVVVSVLLSMLAAGGATFFDVGENEIRYALFQERTITQPLTAEVENLRTNTIKRPDFNQYIQRKDEEYHTQIAINQAVTKSISELQSEMRADNSTQQKDEVILAKDEAQIQKTLQELGEIQGELKIDDGIVSRIATTKNYP